MRSVHKLLIVEILACQCYLVAILHIFMKLMNTHSLRDGEVSTFHAGCFFRMFFFHAGCFFPWGIEGKCFGKNLSCGNTICANRHN